MFRVSKSLLALLLFAFIDLMSMGLVYPMFSAMIFSPDCTLLPTQTTETMRGVWLGILLAAMPITQFFFSPIIGTLSDKKGRRPMLLFCYMMGIIGYSLANVAVRYMHVEILTLSRVFLGIMGSGFAIALAAVADISRSDQEKSRNYSILNMAFGLGFAVGPYLGGKLTSLDPAVKNFALPFNLAGILVIANCLFAYLFFPETLKQKQMSKLNWLEGIKNLRYCLAHKSLRSLFLVSFLVFAGWSFYYEFIPVTWIKTRGFDVGKVGFLYGISALTYAFASGILSPLITKFITPKKTLLLALFLEALVIGALLLPHEEWFLILILSLQNFAMALIYPTLSTSVSDSADAASQGQIMGIFSSIDAFAVSISPLVSGALLAVSDYSPIYIGAFCLLLAGCVFLYNMLFFGKISKKNKLHYHEGKE